MLQEHTVAAKTPSHGAFAFRLIMLSLDNNRSMVPANECKFLAYLINGGYFPDSHSVRLYEEKDDSTSECILPTCYFAQASQRPLIL